MDINGSTISFPFRPSISGSLATTANRADQIAQAIADVIETRQGERVMMPDYGIPNFIFAVMDFGFASRLAYHLEEQIKKYVPLVKSVNTRSAIDENGRAIVSIEYTEVGEILAPKNLVFPVWQYLGEEN